VLTFYQQSIANEAFLRTAGLRESLALLANLLGYEPSRGVSATALLAFFADAGTSLNLPRDCGCNRFRRRERILRRSN